MLCQIVSFTGTNKKCRAPEAGEGSYPFTRVSQRTSRKVEKGQVQGDANLFV